MSKPPIHSVTTPSSSQAGRSAQVNRLPVMAAHAPISVALLKAAYARGINTLDDALAYEMDNQAALYLTQDHREAVAAFLEKRAPVFRGV